MALVSERSCQKRVMSLDLHSESAQRFRKFARYMTFAQLALQLSTILFLPTYVRGSFPFPPYLSPSKTEAKEKEEVVLFWPCMITCTKRG